MAEPNLASSFFSATASTSIFLQVPDGLDLMLGQQPLDFLGDELRAVVAGKVNYKPWEPLDHLTYCKDRQNELEYGLIGPKWGKDVLWQMKEPEAWFLEEALWFKEEQDRINAKVRAFADEPEGKLFKHDELVVHNYLVKHPGEVITHLPE